MRRAIIKRSFSMVEWFGKEYFDYESDAEENVFNEGEEVLVLHEAKPNKNGKLYVIFNQRNDEATVLSEIYLEFLDANIHED